VTERKIEMNTEEIIDADFVLGKGKSFFNAIKWWESKRLLYNVIIVSLVLGIMLFMWTGTQNFGLINATIGSFFYFIAANVFFSIGWGMEVLAKYYFKRNLFLERYRHFFLTLGVLFSVFVTMFMYVQTLYYLQ